MAPMQPHKECPRKTPRQQACSHNQEANLFGIPCAFREILPSMSSTKALIILAVPRAGTCSNARPHACNRSSCMRGPAHRSTSSVLSPGRPRTSQAKKPIPSKQLSNLIDVVAM
jgi:hypothetical protein